MKKNKRLILKEKWQVVLECTIITAVSLIVTTIDSDWTIEYLTFVGILLLITIASVKIIQKFGNTTKYQ
jgi:hypothetical protein